MEIITLIENHPGRDKRLAFEHGFFLYIDTGTSKILFDTGQSGDFVENAWYFGVDLSQLTHIILSHGHYDHSGGLMPLLKAVDITAPLYYGKGYFRGK
ncbi:MBL fold metallo-hydrolase [Eubacterium aggregans]